MADITTINIHAEYGDRFTYNESASGGVCLGLEGLNLFFPSSADAWSCLHHALLQVEKHWQSPTSPGPDLPARPPQIALPNPDLL